MVMAPARVPPVELKPGDVVELKCEPGTEWVVLGPVWCLPALYLLSRTVGVTSQRTTVLRCEIASAYRPAPLVIQVADADPVADAPDEYNPEVELAPGSGPDPFRDQIVWNQHGNSWLSGCGRFIIDPTDRETSHPSQPYFATDTLVSTKNHGLRYSPHGAMEAVKEWCERRIEFDVVSGVGGAEELMIKIPF